MAVNIFQVGDINANLFGAGSTPASMTTGVYASEYPLYADNINGQLSRYTKMMGIWPSNYFNTIGWPAGTGGNDSWAQPNGGANGGAYRPNGGYYVRSVFVTDQNPPSNASYLSYGYIGAFVGGYDKLDYTHDMNAGPITGSEIIAVDYEPPYGHGAGTGIAVAAISNIYQNEWRDSNNLTQDPSAQVTVNFSAYSRDYYSAPAYFALNIDSPTKTLGSGDVAFHAEMRPTRLMTAYGGNGGTFTYSVAAPNGARSPINTGLYEFYPFTGVRKFGSRALSIFMGRDFDGQGLMFGYPFYEDGTYASFVSGGITYADLVYSGTAIDDCPTSRPPVVTGVWLPATTFVLTSAATQVGGITAYSGVFPVVPVPGSSVKILGFVTNPSNNGTFTVATGSTSTTLYLNNGAGVAEIHAATAQNIVANGYEIMDYAGHIQKATQALASLSGTTLPVFSQVGGSVVDGAVTWTDQGATTKTTYITDMRIRHMAHQIVNNEYYLMVQETKFGIFSNKTCPYPLVFMDLVDTWNSGTWALGYRIGGATVWSCSVLWQPAQTYIVGQAVLDPFGFIQVVTSVSGTGTSGNTTPFTSANTPGMTTTDNSGANQVVWTNEGANKSKIFFVAENGSLAVYDSNVTNGIVTNLLAAPALASGQAYGALRIPNGSSTLYAVTGCFGTNPTVSSTDSGGTPGFVGVTPYNIVANTWGSASFPTYNARHNARSLSEMTALRNGWLALLVENVGTVSSSTITNFATGGEVVDWQVLLFNPSTSTWNTGGQITGDGTTRFQFGVPSGTGTNAPLSYENTYNCAIFDVAPTVAGGSSPVILVQSNWRNDKLFVIDGSQSLATISNANVTNVSQGQANDLLHGIASTSQPNSSGTPVPSPLQIRKSQTDDRTIFYFNEFYSFLNTNTSSLASQIFMAPPSWVLTNWNGATGLALIAANTKDTNGNVTTIAKDKMWMFDNSNQQGNGDPWSLISHFVDNTLTTVIHGDIYGNSGEGEFGLHPATTPQQLFAEHNWSSSFFMPTYFKWASFALTAAAAASFGITAYTGTFVRIPAAGSNVTIAGFSNAPNNGVFEVAPGSTSSTLYVFNNAGVVESTSATAGQFVMADNWADAVANSAPVSAISGANISLPYGLIGQFGSTSGSSYAQNEWHTVNVAWGNTKYVRKARLVWAMFAGQTFLTTQTTAMSVVNAVTPSIISPEVFGSAKVVFSYPTNTPVANPGATNTWSYGGGPSGVVGNIDGYITCRAFPMVSGGAPQNSPVQMTLTVNHPSVGTILNRPNQASQTFAFDSQQSGIAGQFGPAAYAFNGNPWNFWFSNTGAGGWVSIDLGSVQTCQSYSFNQQLPGFSSPSAQTMSGWQLQGSNTSITGPWTTIDSRSGQAATRSWAGNVTTPGSYRYYRFISTAVNNSYTALGFLRLFSSTLQTTCNFSEITAFGPFFQSTGNYAMTPQMMRGLTFEVSTNGGGTYTTIYPIWRAHLGGIWCFNRQTGVTNIRITAQTGYPYYNYTNANSLGGSNSYNGYLAFGPFQIVDYQGATESAARLGNGGAGGSTLSVPAGTPPAGSYDPNCIGVAADAVSVSIDTTVSAASMSPQYMGSDNSVNSNGLSPVYGWWAWTQIPTGSASTFPNGFYRVHPFFGFVLFGGPAGNTQSYAGGSDQQQAMPGTNMTIAYHWGRRV